jgi:hypothetical protein
MGPPKQFSYAQKVQAEKNIPLSASWFGELTKIL